MSKGRVEEVRAIKAEGHDLIDELVRTGLRKQWVYAELARRLGRNSHFSAMFTIRETQQAVNALKNILIDRHKKLKEKKEKKLQNKMLSLAEQRKALAALKHYGKGKSLWQRFKEVLLSWWA